MKNIIWFFIVAFLTLLLSPFIILFGKSDGVMIDLYENDEQLKQFTYDAKKKVT